jgi:dihydroorotate dehydrogenase
MLIYEHYLRPLLFLLSAERAHSLATAALRSPAVGALLSTRAPADRRLSCDLAGIPCPHPVGLAPGLDKDGRLLPSLLRMGFGYVTVGSVTPLPRTGNTRPRLVRYRRERAIGNSMGLPSLGAHEVAVIMRRPRPAEPPVIVNVAGFGVAEICQAVDLLHPHADGIELGLICPNTNESDRLDERRMLGDLLEELAGRVRPLFVKLPPFHDDGERQRTMALLDVCAETGIAGVSVSGTRSVPQPALATGRGSLGGAPAYLDTLRIVGEVAGRDTGLTIKASGGVMNGRDATRLLEAGATTVEVYSAFIFRGPRVAHRICRELLQARAVAAPAGRNDPAGAPDRS